jgi:hypothetical protein
LEGRIRVYDVAQAMTAERFFLAALFGIEIA